MRTNQNFCPRQGRRVVSSLSFLVIVIGLFFSPGKASAQGSGTFELPCPLDVAGHFSIIFDPAWQSAHPDCSVHVTLDADRENVEVVLFGQNSGISGFNSEVIGLLTFHQLECAPSLCFELRRSPGGVIVAVLVDV